MLTKEQETRLYLLSDTLDVEIYVVGVGDKTFLPAQSSAPASTLTKDGALAEWVVACLDAPGEDAWWTHTHPAMSAFFSTTDVRGAHNLWEAIRRPIAATVLGKDQEKYVVEIDAEWLEKNPKPKLAPVVGYTWGPLANGWDHDDWAFNAQTRSWERAENEGATSLGSRVVDLVLRYGWARVNETVQACDWEGQAVGR